MTKKLYRNPFSLNREKQMSTLELWQQHLQALRRASQTQEQVKPLRPKENLSETSVQTKI